MPRREGPLRPHGQRPLSVMDRLRDGQRRAWDSELREHGPQPRRRAETRTCAGKGKYGCDPLPAGGTWLTFLLHSYV